MRRVVRLFGRRRILAVLGMSFILLAFVWVGVRGTQGEPYVNLLITFTLAAGPGLFLLYCWHRLPRTDIDPDFYPFIVWWCLGGLGMAAIVLILYQVQPNVNLENPYRLVLDLSALSSMVGLGVGFYDAQARTRERKVRQHNRKLQNTRKQLEASNERFEQFAHAASHDLQEPLRMITNYLGLIERRYGDELDESGEEFIEFAIDGAERMREMIDGLLELSRVNTQGDPFDTVDLDAVLDDVLTDLQFKIEETEAELTRDPLPTVEGDGRQLQLLLQNLLNNAIDYSGDTPPRIHVSAMQEESEWTVSVHDEGIGIDAEDIDHIFDVFERLHTVNEHSGSGIGLTLCKRVVERHNGEIWVESELGEGSVFYFTLPSQIGSLESSHTGVDQEDPTVQMGSE